MSTSLSHITIYTDASFSKHHDIGVIGYSILKSEDPSDLMILDERQIVLENIVEKNNIRSELRAALAALYNCPQGISVKLYSDCQNIINLPKRRNHLEETKFISQAKKQLLTNADLYKKFYSIFDEVHPQLYWIPGHSSHQDLTQIEKNFAILDQAVRKKLRQTLAR